MGGVLHDDDGYDDYNDDDDVNQNGYGHDSDGVDDDLNDEKEENDLYEDNVKFD